MINVIQLASYTFVYKVEYIFLQVIIISQIRACVRINKFLITHACITQGYIGTSYFQIILMWGVR